MYWLCGRSTSPGEATIFRPFARAVSIRSFASATVVVIVLLKWMCLPAASAVALLVVQANWRRDRHRVDVSFFEQIVVGQECLANPKSLGRLGSAGNWIANRGKAHSILNVRLTEMGKNAAHGNASGADDADANVIWHMPSRQI